MAFIPVNKLIRYKIIINEYLKYANSGLNATKIYLNYIYPRFFISQRTFNTILGTNVDAELKALGFTKEDIEKIGVKYESEQEKAVNDLIKEPLSSNPYLQPLTNHNQIF